MPRVQWDNELERFYEVGIDRGMFYPAEGPGVPWNGLIRVTESPIGGSFREFFIDGQKYLSLSSLEEYSGTIEAFASPPGFASYNGQLRLSPGLYVTDQPCKAFGFSYRTLIESDVQGTDEAYKIHVVYNVTARSSTHAYQTEAEKPRVSPYSWNISVVPEILDQLKPTAHFVLDSREIDPVQFAVLENILYGTDTEDPHLLTAQELRQLLYPQFATGSAVIIMNKMVITGTGGPELSQSDVTAAVKMKKMRVYSTGEVVVQRVARLVGFCAPRGEWVAANNTIGPGDTQRLFKSTTLPTTFESDGTPNNVVIIQSFKTMNTNVAAYIASIPASRQEVWMIYFHEPENDMSASTFQANFKSQANLIHAQNNPKVKVVYAASGYQYSGSVNSAARAGDYARGLGNGYADIFSLDCYQGKDGAVVGWDWTTEGLRTLSHWVNWINVVTDVSIVGTIKPLAITEYGVDNPVGATNRYNRIKADHDYLLSAFQGANPISPYPLQSWCYWWQDSDVANPAKFTDSSTILLWQSYEVSSSGVSIGTGAVRMKKMRISGSGSTGAEVSVITGAVRMKKMRTSGSGSTLGSPYKVASGFVLTGSTSRSVPVTTACPAGDGLLVHCSTNNNAAYATALTDSKGNIYTLDKSSYATTPTMNTFRSPGATGGPGGGQRVALTTSDTLTFTMSATSGYLAAVAIGLPAALVGAYDVIPASITTGSDTTPTASATPTQNNDVAIALFATAGTGGAPTPNAPYTDLGYQQGSTSQYSSQEFRLLGTGTTGVSQSATETIVSAAWKSILYLFKKV